MARDTDPAYMPNSEPNLEPCHREPKVKSFDGEDLAGGEDGEVRGLMTDPPYGLQNGRSSHERMHCREVVLPPRQGLEGVAKDDQAKFSEEKQQVTLRSRRSHDNAAFVSLLVARSES